MTLILHRAERTDALADGLAQLLSDPLDDPFVQELVIVPTRGVERWLAQSLSHRLGVGPRGGDGICAGVRFVAPRSLVALLTGRERDDPWQPDRLVWPLLAEIDAHLDEPWCSTLARHLGHGETDELGQHRAGRRYAVAHRLARLFASYAVQRPTVLTAWSAGELTDGTGASLGDDLAWQAQLWQVLVERVGEPSPAQRHARTVAALHAGDDPAPDAALPPRISFFGHTRMPVTELELIEALAAHREVHLWLPQPSEALWAQLAPTFDQRVVRRIDDTSADVVRHPLLASLGRDARELQRALPRGSDMSLPPAAPAPGSVLGWLQHDIHRNAMPDDETRDRRAVANGDRSVQVHACHGAARQVEVLREVLTGMLQDDPTLEPRDILVMCPDIESYVPLIQAAFGLSDHGDTGGAVGGHPAHGLCVKLADRSLARTNSLFEIASDLVEFSAGRLRASDLRAFVGRGPVRRRFRLDEEDLERIASWIEDAEIRWGMDGEQRGRFGLRGLEQNTWRFGLRRLLLGVAMSPAGGAGVGEVLPVDGVESAGVGLVGRFAELLDRVDATLHRLQEARSSADWMSGLLTGVGGLAEITRENLWQQAQFERELESVRTMAVQDTALRVADVRELLSARLEGRATRANFRTGTLTVCTMMPMRSVPHRVICLLGLDDGVFPRTSGVDGDDVLARDPLTGERDARSEDRQLLLDAVLAATDRLVITYTGAGEHTGAERPPAPPLGELIDAARRTASWPQGRDVVVRHPLQPFDARNLVPGALDTPEPFSFDRTALAGARAAQDRVPRRSRLVTAPLAPLSRDDVSFADLARFFEDPLRAFVRDRLDVALPFDGEEPGDAIPIELGGLQKWAIGDRALRASLVGTRPDEIRRMERLRGGIPPGALGDEVLQTTIDGVKALRGPILELLQRETSSVDIDVQLLDGRRLTGTIGDLRGEVHLLLTYSTLAAKQRLQSWLALLALIAGHPDRPWQAAAAGWLRGGKRRQAGYYLAGGLDQPTALRHLTDLADVYGNGMRGPIPLPLKTSLAYADKLRQRPGNERAALFAAQREWEGNGFGQQHFPGEGEAAAPCLVYGEAIPLTELLAERPETDEAWNGSTSRLGQYAQRVWGPLLENQGAQT